MLSFRACSNFVFYQHARLELTAYLAYLHIHNTLLLRRFYNVTLALHGEKMQKQVNIMAVYNLQYFFQLSLFTDGFLGQQFAQ